MASMFQTPHFVTGPWTREKPVFLEDREYGMALDALVKACSDVLVISADGQRVLLGRRKVEPQPDWWYIGGRARPGDTTQVAASRNVRRELGLEFAPERFRVVCSVSMVWAYRAQAPQENGTADISTIHALRLTPEEEANGQTIRLDPDEYSESKWWDLDEVINTTPTNRFHPCLIHSLKSFQAQQALEALETATENNNGEEDVAQKALAFVRAMQAARQGTEQGPVQVLFDAEACQYVRQGDDTQQPQPTTTPPIAPSGSKIEDGTTQLSPSSVINL